MGSSMSCCPPCCTSLFTCTPTCSPNVTPSSSPSSSPSRNGGDRGLDFDLNDPAYARGRRHGQSRGHRGLTGPYYDYDEHGYPRLSNQQHQQRQQLRRLAQVLPPRSTKKQQQSRAGASNAGSHLSAAAGDYGEGYDDDGYGYVDEYGNRYYEDDETAISDVELGQIAAAAAARGRGGEQARAPARIPAGARAGAAVDPRTGKVRALHAESASSGGRKADAQAPPPLRSIYQERGLRPGNHVTVDIAAFAWRQLTGSSGRPYYFSVLTGQTTLARPAILGTYADFWGLPAEPRYVLRTNTMT